MSDRRGHLHFRLNYAEELRTKKELERLLKPPHRAIRHDMVELRPKSSSPLSLMQDPSIPLSNQFNSLSRPRSGVRSKPSPAVCQATPTSAVSRREAEIQHNDENKAGIVSKAATSMSRNITQEPKDQTPLHRDVPETEHNIQRPAIASLVGTTKPVMVFTRPEPPSKPRSYMPQESVKPRVARKFPVIEKKVSKKQKVTPASSFKMKKDFDVRSAEDSDDSSTSSSSDSQDSEDLEKRVKRSKKKKKRHLRKSQTLATSEQGQVGSGDPTSSLSPTADRLPHVEEPPATDSKWDHNSAKGTIERATISVVSPVKTTARSVDEIIASLRSPQSYTASDLMIKELMESVLGLDYNITSGETTEEKTHEEEKETIQPHLDDTETSEQPELQVPEADTTLMDPRLSTQMSLFMDKDDEEQSHQRSTSAGEQTIKSVKTEEMTEEEEAKEILKSSSQISISDIIHVKGGAAPLTRRETPKIRPSAALLATWTPRAK